MTINSVALITGALSVSAALAWNKAISETLNRMTKRAEPLLQAIVITLIIMLVVYLINNCVAIHTKIHKTPLKYSTIQAGGDANSKVSLWNNNIF